MMSDGIVPKSRAIRAAAGLNSFDRLARRLVLGRLGALRRGRLTLADGPSDWSFGQSAELDARVHVRHPSFWRRVASGGILGAGAAYVDGLWTCDDLTRVVRLFLQNAAAFDHLNRGWARLSAPLLRLFHAQRRNTLAGSRRNIADHYDLSNDFYALWLDETMCYSSAVFARPGMSLTEASIEKMDRLCRKLDLRPGMRLLEIGTGWGGLALHAAQRYGCHVTTTTISQRQHEHARARVAAAGLEQRVNVVCEDYRQLRGRYDRVVSVEMIEAVGHEYYDVFFRTLSDRLEPHGLAALQVITVADRYYEQARRNVDFIKRYIFPGSCIPSIGAMAASIARVTDLTLCDLEDLTPHYAATLRAWRERFVHALPQVRELGFSEAFIRMWEFYLCYCEAGFDERATGLVQLVLSKPQASWDALAAGRGAPA